MEVTYPSDSWEPLRSKSFNPERVLKKQTSWFSKGTPVNSSQSRQRLVAEPQPPVAPHDSARSFRDFTEKEKKGTKEKSLNLNESKKKNKTLKDSSFSWASMRLRAVWDPSSVSMCLTVFPPASAQSEREDSARLCVRVCESARV